VRVAIAACCLCLSACGKPLNDDDCYTLLDRYTELLIKSQDPKTPAHQIASLQQRARELAKNDPVYEFSACSKKVSRRNFECAMAAPSADEMERCLIF
jgi:hypothetical protein